MRTLAAFVVIVLLAAAGGAYYVRNQSRAPIEYRTATIGHGDVVSTIAATGTLEPEEVVDVGAQVAGLILAFGKDANGHAIDYRSPVEPDMVLAKIDDAVYKADVDTANAQLAQANANVQRSNADLATANAKLTQAENNWNRAQSIGTSGALTKNDYDMYKADYETAKAAVAVAEAEIAQAKTGIAQADAALSKAQRNLEFCTIRSPVKGVIIDRRVNIGQTVVSSLNAPSLFLIAKDLTRMQIWVAVNEADVGRIKPGAPVTFTCDAFPDRTFHGTVGKIRLNATMAQNVVLYTVEVNTDNPDNVLLPYLSARVQFEVQRADDVQYVPNAALRWYPSSVEEVAPDARESFKPLDTTRSESPAAPDAKRPHARQQQRSSTTARSHEERRATLWVRDGQFVRPVEVHTGLTDGTNTAVRPANGAEPLADGTEVVTGELAPGAAAPSGSQNPFMPQFRRH